MAILETKLIGTPASGSTIVVVVGSRAHDILVHMGTHPSDLLHPQPARLPVLGSKYTHDPVPISVALMAIHPAFWLQAYPLAGHGWVAPVHIVVGQLICAIELVTPWENDTQPTFPSQNDPESTPVDVIVLLPTSNITFPGYPPPVKLVPPSPLQPLLRGNVPLRAIDGFERAKIVHPMKHPRIRAKNILPFIKYGIY